MDLEATGEAIRTVANQVGPSVVAVGRRGRGSGFVLSDGLVVTNAHNLRDRTTTIHLADKDVVPAEVAGHDVAGDLVVLKADFDGIPGIEWPQEVDPVRVGTPVVALSNPGARGLRATLGFVSAVDQAFRGPGGRLIEAGFEHTAPLMSGSSGGPVVTLDGKLLGINTHRLGEGFYLAIPADDERKTSVDRLAAGESAQPKYIGVGLAPSDVARRLRRSVGLDERDGLLVRQVVDGGPADRAGIAVGDLIVGAGGEPVSEVAGLHRALATAGDDVVLSIVRGVDGVELTVSFQD